MKVAFPVGEFCSQQIFTERRGVDDFSGCLIGERCSRYAPNLNIDALASTGEARRVHRRFRLEVRLTGDVLHVRILDPGVDARLV